MNEFFRTDQEKRTLAAARTLLFNYGQGLWTPHSVYQDLCVLLSVPSKLSALPSFKHLPFRFSFFSKKTASPYNIGGCYHFMLYNGPEEKDSFLVLPSSTKLCWMRAFYWAQELLFNFPEEEIENIFKILACWPGGGIESIPFSLEKRFA